MLRILGLFFGLVLGCSALAIFLVRSGNRAQTMAAIDRLRQVSTTSQPANFTEADLIGLPAPVARYFGAVLGNNNPVVRYARLTQQGQFLLRPTPDGWRPFVATEHMGTAGAGFVWDARIRFAPGFDVHVRDSFVNGAGGMVATLMGVWPLVAVEGTPEIGAGALQRYLAELVWLPTALLPRQGVVWTELDDSSARATLTVNNITVSLDFYFGADNLVNRVYTPERFRDVNGRTVPTPWQGRFWRYEEHDGMKIPMAGEVEWLLPDGPQIYWRGEITEAICSGLK
jgi:hypothetical protein